VKHLRHQHHYQCHQDRRAGQSLFEAVFHTYRPSV
jgi:hypothetical protein